jgi:hypothetical protein
MISSEYDTVLQPPAFLARELKIQVRRIHGGTQYQSKRLLDPADVEPRGRKNAFARSAQGIGQSLGDELGHGDHITRCDSAGKSWRAARCAARSSCATITPCPDPSRASTVPQ